MRVTGPGVPAIFLKRGGVPLHLMDMKPALASADGLSDADLIGRIRAGDATAMQALMRRHNRTLFRTARAILRDDADAEDAVQEAYIQAYRSLASFRGEAKFSTWLVRIVANEALMRRRRNTRSAAVIPIDSAEQAEAAMSYEPGPENETLRGQMRELLEARIDRLPDGYRAVFVLRALEELTVEETASALGIPDATVRTRYFRARSLLREWLARDIDLTMEDAFGFAGARCDRVVANVLRLLGLAEA
jgi:RNA polymerase sigma-70 factor (ECF subfamily)